MDDNTSLEHQLALLDPEQVELILSGLSPAQLRDLVYNWDFNARPDQLQVTNSTADIILFSAGRGAGKTLTGAQWVRKKIETSPTPIRIALLGRTSADVRDTMIQGPSGLTSVFPPDQRPVYVPSARRVNFHDGSTALMFSAEEPSQLRGPQAHCAWADEVGAFPPKPDDSGLTAWDNLDIATRLGQHPQILATTTPKRTAVLRELYERAKQDPTDVELVTVSTFANKYLSDRYIKKMSRLYDGTRIGKQELFAELLEDTEGAMVKGAEIRQVENHPRLVNVVVGVDPSVSADPNDECGIVAVGAGHGGVTDKNLYVLADYSVKAPPSVWAAKAVQVARDHHADIVVETNQGGQMAVDAIKAIDPRLRVTSVKAVSSKSTRAEPVAMLYQQGRVFHCSPMPQLVDQLTSWVPGQSGYSPDRLDALVHAVNALVWGRNYTGPVKTTRAPARIEGTQRRPIGSSRAGFDELSALRSGGINVR